MLQPAGRVAWPNLKLRNCLSFLQTILIMRKRGLVSEFMWGVFQKQKVCALLSLNSLFFIFEVCKMVVYLTAFFLDDFPPKNWNVVIKGRDNRFLLLNMNLLLLKFPICSFFFTCYSAIPQLGFLNFLYGMHYLKVSKIDKTI